MDTHKQLQDIFLISNRKFGDTLRQLLTYLKVTQTDLANLMGVNRTVVSRIVNHPSSPRRKTIEAIERALYEYNLKFDCSLIQGIVQWYIESAFGEVNTNFKSTKDTINEIKTQTAEIAVAAPKKIDRDIVFKSFEKIKEQYVYLIISLDEDSSLEKSLFSNLRRISKLMEDYDLLSNSVLKVLKNKQED